MSRLDPEAFPSGVLCVIYILQLRSYMPYRLLRQRAIFRENHQNRRKFEVDDEKFPSIVTFQDSESLGLFVLASGAELQ